MLCLLRTGFLELDGGGKMAQAQWRHIAGGLLAAMALALGGCGLQSPIVMDTPTATSGPAVAAATATTTTGATAAPAPHATNTPSGPATCQPNQLTLSMQTSQGAMGHVAQQDEFTNKSTTTCTLYGYPGAVMLDSQQKTIATKTNWQTTGFSYSNQQKQLVTLHPGGVAYFIVEWSDVPVGAETSCPTSTYLSVTPPNDFSVITIADQINACNGGTLGMSPVEPNKIWP